jgi:putative monooxygenase
MLEQQQARIKGIDEVPSDTRRGGDLRTILSPKTVGSTTGFMGVATIAPGDKITEHYHPYSEEFVFLVRGELVVRLDGTPTPLRAGQGVLIPINVRHRFMNEGTEESFMVFHLCPLAPRPDLGHVDTE